MHNNPCVAALPQLDRGSDYESERHRFESYTPHQLNFKASGNGGFFLYVDILEELLSPCLKVSSRSTASND